MSDDRLQCETISSQCHWIHSKAQQTPNRYLFGTTELQVAPYQTIPWQFYFFYSSCARSKPKHLPVLKREPTALTF